MKHCFVLFLTGVVLLCACNNPKKPAELSKQDSLSKADSGRNAFFPVAEFLESEILYLDSVPLGLKRFTTINGKTDSAYILVPEFNKLALEFLPSELHDGRFEKNYTENAFMDKTTQSVSFTYSTSNRDLSLQRVDVQTAPGNSSQKVKSIYMEKSRSSGDSLILQKMFWRAGRSFQITTLTTVKGKTPAEQQVSVVWFTDEE